MPMSTTRLWPVTPLDRSDVKNKAAVAISRGATRPRLPVFGYTSKTSVVLRWLNTRGVGTFPGRMLLARMPYSAHSAAIVRVSAVTPAFAAPYAPWKGALYMLLIEEMLVRETVIFFSIINLAASRQTRKT